MKTTTTTRRALACVATLALLMAGLPASARWAQSTVAANGAGGAPPGADGGGPASAARPAGAPPAGCTSATGSGFHQVVAGRDAGTPDRQIPLAPKAATAAATTVAYDGVRLTVGPDAVDAPVTIGISRLGAAQLPKMGTELTNVTSGKHTGWRFTPHPYRFAKPIEVSLPYDPASVAPTFSPQDVYTFYFDDRAGCWKALDRVSVDEKKHVVVSRTDHFTDMVNAVLTLPEYPGATSFNPTQIKDLKAASPSAGVTMVSPPAASNTGEARLSYPITVPPGRAGLQPQLSIAYDSTRGNGWLGEGWDLSVPTIAVDTRWGVPRYNGALETETYLVGEEQLAPVAHRGPLVARTAEKTFRPRVEGSFARIIRHGSTPSTYSWETVDKAGTHSFFGGSPDSTLRDDAANIFQWALREMRDPHGNVMRYHTVVQEDVGSAGGTVQGRNLYLQKITYAGSGAAPEGPYAVTFVRDRDLDEPRRADVGIDARGGFKRVTADLLRRIEVRLNDLPVRAYELAYTTGAFHKTLLASVTQLGEDDRPFTTQRFGYYDDIRDADGAYQAFSELDWTSPDDDLRNGAVNAIDGGGQSGAINSNTSTEVGGHLYVGFGPRPSKADSFGVKAGFNRSTDTGLLALTDVDGDNLPDKVFKRGNGVGYRKNLSKPGGQPRFADEVTPLQNLPGIFAQRSNSSTVGVEGYPGSVAVQLDHIDTFTTNDRYFADVNADGITDLVDSGNVLFGRVGPDGAPVYGLSAETPVPIGSAPVNTDGLVDDLSADREREIDSHPLVDTVRRWVAPYDGSVAITGGVRLIQDTGAERAAYTRADGVRVAVQREDDELWSRVIGPTDYAEHAPAGIEAVNVKRGDRLYFRVQSRFDGAYDQVAWDPQVAYLGVADSTDVNGLDPYRYRASADFTLGGRASEVPAPLTGTVHLSGNLVKKAATTDDVTAVITRNGETIFSRTLPAAQSGEIPVDLDVSVEKGQKLAWRIQVDTPIDLSQVAWQPKASYAEPELVIDAPYAVDMYPVDDLTAPQQAYTAPADGTLTVDPTLAVQEGDQQTDATVVFTVKRRGALLAKEAITITDGQVSGDGALTVPVAAGDELFFDFSTLDPTLAPKLATRQVDVGFDPGPRTPAPNALHSAAVEGAFPQPYRGWGAIGYNGNRDRADQPIKQGDLVIDESYRDQFPDTLDPQAQRDAFAADPRITPPKSFPYFPDPAKDRWGNGDNTWAGRTSASSSRFGAPAITVPTAGDVATVTAVPRLSRSTQISLTGGVSGPVGSIGGSIATGDSTGELDYLDLNGDGFPDVVGAAGVQYTDPTGQLGGTRAALPDGDVRRTHTVAGNASAGSAARTITTGRGHAAPPASTTANTAEAGNDMPPLGVGGSLGGGSSDTRFDLLDINGDSLPDRVYADGRAALNLGYRFAEAEPWPGGPVNDGETDNRGVNVGFNTDFYGLAGGASYSVGHSSTKGSLLDVTGDGLADRVFDGNPMRVAVNTGSGFAAPQPFHGSADVNDDANAQLGGGVYLTFTACFGGIGGCIITNPGVSLGTGIGRTEKVLRDINGDGYADQLRSSSDNELKVAQNNTGRTNLLKTVDQPMGSRIDLDYTRDGNTYDQPQSRFVLSRVAVVDGHPGDGEDTQLTTYRYAGGIFDRLEREFRGYATVVGELRNPYDSKVQRTTTTEYATSSHYTRGLPTRTRIADADGRLFNETVDVYQLRDVARPTGAADPRSTTAVLFPAKTRTEQRFYEGRETPGKSTRIEFSYDDVGNVVRQLDIGDPGGGDDVETRIRYTAEDAACAAGHIVGVATAMDVRGDGALMRHREATVNCATGDVTQHRAALADGQVATTDLTYFANGNVQSVTEPPNAAGRRYKRTYEYDPAVATHVTAVTDSFGYRSTTTYNLKYGLPETTTDVNGQRSRTTYDRVGRVDIVTGAYETDSNHPTVDIDYHPEASTPYAVTRNIDRNADGSIRTNSIDTITFTDGLGRIVQTKKDATLAGAEAMTVSGKVEYDFAGRVVLTRYPTSEAKGPLNTRFNPREDGVGPTRISYDVLDRATRTVLPDDTVTTVAYGFGADRADDPQFETAVTDAKGVTTRTYTDVHLRTTAVKQLSPAAGHPAIWTSYDYDALGEITNVVDDHQNKTRSTYDNLGRRTSVDTPDTGLTRYGFDLADNLTTEVTANLAAGNQAITYDYDVNRLVAVHYPNNPDDDVTYAYGAPGAPDNAAGRITTVQDAAGTVNRGYGPLGEVTTETRTVSNEVATPVTYTTRYRYDTWNRVQQMTYPDGEVLTYHYNNGGLVDGATGVKAGTSYPYLSRIDYDEFEQRTLQQTGNGVTTRYTYDAADRRLATLQAAQADGTTFQQVAYDYDPVGNITTLAETAPPVGGIGGPSTQTFGYDDLNRLVSSEGEYHPAAGQNDRYRLSLSYDTLGDITTKDQTHDLVTGDGTATAQPDTSYRYDYTYAEARPHAPATAGPLSFSYDANGNMTRRSGPDGQNLELAWNDANQVSCSTGNTGSRLSTDTALVAARAAAPACDISEGASVRYVYDDQGERVVKNGGPNDVSIYPNQNYTQRNNTAYKHIFIGDTRLVSKLVQPSSVVENGQFYFQTDHLGSTAYGTDKAGKVVEHAKYLPSGESWAGERSTATPSPYGFTGKERDDETGLYYYGARYYDPKTAAWQSPDPAMDTYLDGKPNAGVYSPVNLAAYTYANNNPVIVTDPTGRFSTADFLKGAGKAVIYTAAGAVAVTLVVGSGGTLGVLATGALTAYSAYSTGVATAELITGRESGTGRTLSEAEWSSKFGELVGGAIGGAAGGRIAGQVKAWAGRTWGTLRGYFGKARSGADEAVGNGKAATTSEGCNSFSADTKVLKGDGSTVPIEDLEVGDRVLATDPLTGETSVRTVTKTHLNADTDLTDLTVTDAAGNTEVIHTTQHHPFWDETRKAWVDAFDLRPGELLRTVDGAVQTVMVARSYTGAREMLNLTVATVHTYYVMAGDTPILVHNAGPCKPFIDRHGHLTDGNYIVSEAAMAPHTTGSFAGKVLPDGVALPAGKSQFLYKVDASAETLKAAQFADANNLWVGNKAKVFVNNGPVGVLGGTGELTSWITVTRAGKTLHAWPSSAP